MMQSFICFLLTNDLPFRLIEDPYHAKFLPEPKSRQCIGDFCDSTASIILQKIAQQAETFIDVIGVFDGWTDCAALSYLGLTINTISKTPENNYDYHVVVIGHIPIHDVHITHEILAPIITEKFHEVNISIPMKYSIKSLL